MEQPRLLPLIVVLLLLLFPASDVVAQSQPIGEWIADPVTGCRIWNPYPVPNLSA